VPSRILVTGGAGFIGSALVRQLVGAGHEVTTFDLLTYAGNLDSLGEALDAPRHHFVRGDVADPVAVRKVLEQSAPSVIFHLAAESHVDRSIDGPAAFVQTNVVGSQVLLSETVAWWRTLATEEREGFRFIHVSTDEVFGSVLAPARFTEASPYAPTSPYSASKAAADHLARAWQHTYGLPVIVTNCSNNYGPCQFPEKLIPLQILKGLAGEPMPVYGMGENVRDWLHVEDHARGLIAAAERGAPGETYLFGGDSERRNLDVVGTIADLVDGAAGKLADGRKRRELIAFVTDRPGHDLRYAIDASKAKRELGWAPAQSFDAGLRATVEWYLSHRDWWERVRSGAYRGERLGLGTEVGA
jgi:dTDP-glucose 4,6-dehydratase